jgi:hypothetical protein
VNEFIKIAVEYAIHIAYRKLRAMIFDQPVGRENVAPDLAAEVNLEL